MNHYQDEEGKNYCKDCTKNGKEDLMLDSTYRNTLEYCAHSGDPYVIVSNMNAQIQISVENPNSEGGRPPGVDPEGGEPEGGEPEGGGGGDIGEPEGGGLVRRLTDSHWTCPFQLLFQNYYDDGAVTNNGLAAGQTNNAFL